MLVYRINSLKYKSDISGTGAFLNGGRWNSQETYLLYASMYRSLALLESMVHLKENILMHWYILAIELPVNELQVDKIETLQLPLNWINDEILTKQLGDKFVKDNKALCLKVPSVIVPEEYNVLINTKHKLFEKVIVKETKFLNIDKRLV